MSYKLLAINEDSAEMTSILEKIISYADITHGKRRNIWRPYVD